MFAAQDHSQNSKAFNPTPPNTRKCILATNIAETSITIPGIKYVIDTGKCKEKQYLARITGGGFDTLLTRDITKSSAMQRAGRAGREVSISPDKKGTAKLNFLPFRARVSVFDCTQKSPSTEWQSLGNQRYCGVVSLQVSST